MYITDYNVLAGNKNSCTLYIRLCAKCNFVFSWYQPCSLKISSSTMVWYPYHILWLKPKYHLFFSLKIVLYHNNSHNSTVQICFYFLVTLASYSAHCTFLDLTIGWLTGQLCDNWTAIGQLGSLHLLEKTQVENCKQNNTVVSTKPLIFT